MRKQDERNKLQMVRPQTFCMDSVLCIVVIKRLLIFAYVVWPMGNLSRMMEVFMVESLSLSPPDYIRTAECRGRGGVTRGHSHLCQFAVCVVSWLGGH